MRVTKTAKAKITQQTNKVYRLWFINGGYWSNVGSDDYAVFENAVRAAEATQEQPLSIVEITSKSDGFDGRTWILF